MNTNQKHDVGCYSSTEARTWVTSSCDLRYGTSGRVRHPTEGTGGFMYRQEIISFCAEDKETHGDTVKKMHGQLEAAPPPPPTLKKYGGLDIKDVQ